MVTLVWVVGASLQLSLLLFEDVIGSPPPPPPPPPCLVTTTGKSTLFSIFDDDIVDNDNYLNIDIDVDNIQNNGGDDNNNYDIDDNGDTNGDSTRLHQVVNAIIATDDSLNCEANELFMNSFVW